MQVRTVLCPVDRSEISKRAFDYAVALARTFGARLSILEVIDWALPPVSSYDVALFEMPPEVQTAAFDALNALAAPAKAAGIATELSLETGNVVGQILARAEATSADLIVLGSHGRSGFDRLALGSVAEKVLRRARCPVLTVPPAAPGVPTILFRAILCATDFSDGSLGGVRAARQLAVQMGGRCLVAHVVNWPFDPVSGLESAAFRRSLEAEAHEKLSRTIEQTSDSGGHVEAIVATGTPKDEILALAATHEADLVVMGVSGRGALDRAMLGSTVHGVIRRAGCPVLTVPRG